MTGAVNLTDVTDIVREPVRGGHIPAEPAGRQTGRRPDLRDQAQFS